MIADTIIRAGETNAKDIVLYAPPDWSLAFPKGEQETTITLGSFVVMGAAIDSKLKRWTGTEWIQVGTLIVFQ